MNKKAEEITVQKIVEGIQEKKGHRIVVMDLRELETKPALFFVIAEGNSNTQVCAIADEVEEYVRKQIGEKPAKVVGVDSAQWIAMDYGDAIVHIFQREAREFYDIESLWADGKVTEIEEV